MSSRQPNQTDYGLPHPRTNATHKFSPAAHNNQQYFGQEQLLPLQSTNANSVNANQLIFRAREIYDKYRGYETRPHVLSTQTANHRHQQLPDAYGWRQERGRFEANYAETSIKGSFQSQDRTGSSTGKNINKQIKTAETVPSITNFLPKNSPKNADKLENLLYVLVGILSSHLRVNLRIGFQTINQYQKSVKKGTDFYRIISHVIRKKIRTPFTVLMQITNPASPHKNFIDFQGKSPGTKIDRLDSSLDPNFAMQESAVEKGLKFLQERSQQRKKLEEKMRNSQYAFVKKQHKSQQPAFLKQKQPASTSPMPPSMYSTSNSDQKSSPVFQFNHQIQKKSASSRHNIAGEYSHHTAPSQPAILKLARQNSNKQSINTEYQDIYLRLERQSRVVKDYSKSFRFTLQLNERPLATNYQRQIFDRPEISERKYYLNPTTFKQAQPDCNEVLMPVLSNMTRDDLEIYQPDNEEDLYRKIAGKSGNETNLLEDTLPIFDPTNNQNATRAWEPPQRLIQQLQKKTKKIINPNMKSIESSGNKNSQQDQKQFDNLPSFNEKNRINIKNEQLSSAKKKIDGAQEPRKIQEAQQLGNQQGQRERRKSDFVGYTDDYDSRKLSEDDQQFPEQKQLGNENQYFTHKNLAAAKEQNIRSSFDLVSSKKSKRPLSRPKSMTYSISTHQLNRKLEKQQDVERVNPVVSQNTSQNTDFSNNQEKGKPKITIKYQSPGKEIKMTNSIHLYPQPQLQQPPWVQRPQPQQLQLHMHVQGMPQQPPRFFQQNRMDQAPYFNMNPIPNFNGNVHINNKPVRALSSQARFFGSRPLIGQQPPGPPNYQQENRPRVETNYYVNSPTYAANFQNLPNQANHINQNTFMTGQQSLKLIRPAATGAQTYGLMSIRNVKDSQSPSHSSQQDSHLQFHKKKGIEISPQHRLTESVKKGLLSRYSSDKRLQANQEVGKGSAKAQVPNVVQNSRRLKVVTAEYH